MKMQRPNKYQYYLDIALRVAQRGTCLRRNYGAVIVNHDEQVGSGYTGAPRGKPNCCDLGKCKRQELNVPPGERYELCRSVHAEMNAVISAGRNRCIGGTIYISGFESSDPLTPIWVREPCSLCKRIICNVGIVEVILQEENVYQIMYPRDWEI